MKKKKIDINNFRRNQAEENPRKKEVKKNQKSHKERLVRRFRYLKSL